ncbi:MAG: RecX family transcriptional regulator [Prolixibacteraceae bacterium]|jgi:regulatory protein|nr:RecX family transcriptional regulator [Prolixibacteraceae bacterium]
MAIFKQPMTYREAYTKATDLCSRSEKCLFDLRQKCREWQLSMEESSKLIDSLMKGQFIDHERYATSFVNDKFRFNKWGKIKLTYILRQKHIEEKYIQNALSNLPEDSYHKVLLGLLSAKAKTIRETDSYTRKGKLLAFAQSRGFEVDIAIRIIAQM